MYKPPSSSKISLKDIPVPYYIRSNDPNPTTCIRGNVTSPECILNTPTASADCLAYCPDAPAEKKVIKYIVPNSETTGGWSANTSKLIDPAKLQKNMISSSIQYITPSVSASCNLINAGSSNCKNKNSYGCQAYCNTNSPFIIEQRCPNNENSCNVKSLKWFKK